MASENPRQAREWTEDQRRGIETVGKSLLVSAAAGSGKTSVLAERCAHLVCDVADQCGVDELLVVTFTEAAAAEMKARIHQTLLNRHTRKPSDHTNRQLAMIDRTSISTLHGFCSRLLRQHFHLLGLDPDFLILDADEAELLKAEVARELFADHYDAEETTDAFRKLIDSYGDGKDERLIDLIIHAHDTLCSVIDSADWLTRAQSRIEQAIALPLHETELGQAYVKTLKQHLTAMKAECADAEKAVKQLKNFAGYVEDLRGLYRMIDHWIKVLDSHGLEAFAAEAAAVELPRLLQVSSKVPGKDAAKEHVDTVRNAIKEGHWRRGLAFTPEEWKDGLTRIQPHVETFLALVGEFTDRYTKAKEEEGGLDFSDLERLALTVLRDGKTGGIAPSAVAKMYHKQFRHVLVDEYQDINEVQDAILTLISHECLAATRRPFTANLFTVGDVKQSIYRFRLAEPARFLKRRDAYSEPGSHGTVVDLQQNFRSRAPLLDAVNRIFQRIMTTDAADLNYDESQKLKPGAVFPPGDGQPHFAGAPIELHLLLKDAQTATASDEESREVELDRSEREATLLARRILEITGKTGNQPMLVADRAGGYRPARFGDIVILLRSMRYKADQFAEQLRNAGIAVHSESATGYFEATEINDILSLLKVLDNQRQDIPLAGFLRSPLAGLPDAEEQLARIRLAYPGDPPVPFHEAVARYAVEQNDELAARLRDIRAQLDKWRKLARQRPLAEVLWTIFDHTGYLAFVSGLPRGEQRQANLIELHERARQFGTFRRQGLSRFLEFLEKLKSERDLGQASIASEAEDVVRIMSIHRSKGLEFPIVLLPDLGKAINLQDAAGSILLDRQAGLGLQVVDDVKQIRYPSLAWTVVQQRLKQQTLAEEMRVLYVALTRAKEHLILVGTCREDQPGKWTDKWQKHEGPLAAETVLGARSMLDWIGITAAVLSNDPSPAFDVKTHTMDEIAAMSAGQQSPTEMTPTQKSLAMLEPLTPAPAESQVARAVIERVSWPYPFTALSNMRATQSVTALTKSTAIAPRASIQSSGPTEMPALELDRLLTKPAFLVGELPPDAADRGTATHAVLEHLDFKDTADADAIQRQVDRLVQTRRVTAELAALVDLDAIQWLMQQDVGRLLREGESVMRELPIYCAAPLVGLGGDDLDQVMIRGRIDVLLSTSDGYVIVDYKTDRVSGELLEERTNLYAKQLSLYRRAIEQITGSKVKEAVIVFLTARECRTVD